MILGFLLFVIPFSVGWFLSDRVMSVNEKSSASAVWLHSIVFAFVCLFLALILTGMNVGLAGIAGGGGFLGVFQGLHQRLKKAEAADKLSSTQEKSEDVLMTQSSSRDADSLFDNTLKRRLILIAALAGVLLALYFVISPYQNCMRAEFSDSDYCLSQTSW
jgi:hypothetical protein